MKRIVLSIALFSSIISSAQTVIVDEKYEKKNEPVGYRYLPNSKKFVVFKGKQVPYDNVIYDAYSYTIGGVKETLFENEKLENLVFSIDENSFRAKDLSERGIKYFIDNKYYSNIKASSFNDVRNTFFGITSTDLRIKNLADDDLSYSLERRSFNKFDDLGFTDEKGSDKITFEKDNIFLEVFNIKNNNRSRFKIEKPNLSLLIGDSFADFKSNSTFNCRLNSDNTFDLITKSLSKDKKSTILYKDTYDFFGKKLKSISFKLDLKDGFFSISNNLGGGLNILAAGGGPGQGLTRSRFDILSINNYFEDKSNGEIFIYGVFSSNDLVSPCGFYIFKFDKEGNKIWESIGKIKDSYKTDDYSDFDVSLIEYNKNLIFYYSSSNFSGFSNYSVLDKSSGSILKSEKVSYDNDKGYKRYISFINNTYVTKDKSLKKKTFSNACFIAMDLDKNFFNYINSVSSEKKTVYFETVFSNQGIWLVETDNKEYYKVLLFKE